MRPIRVVFASDVSPLARDLLSAIFAGREGIEVVGGVPALADVPRSEIDVVINEVADGVESSWPSALFVESARRKLAITINSMRVMLFEIQAHTPAMVDPSADELITEIRNALRD